MHSLFFHSNINVGDFSDGFLHPISGFDHLLAMLSVGLISTFLDKKHIYLLPMAFVASMLMGGLLGYEQVLVYYTEQPIALSVLVLGILIVIKLRTHLIFVYSITTLFGIAHGYAHGIEIPYAAAPIKYFIGFLSATALVHVIGIIIGVFTENQKKYPFSRLFGIMVMVSGIFLIIQKC